MQQRCKTLLLTRRIARTPGCRSAKLPPAASSARTQQEQLQHWHANRRKLVRIADLGPQLSYCPGMAGHRRV